jgi:hypothetical protein
MNTNIQISLNKLKDELQIQARQLYMYKRLSDIPKKFHL